MNTPLHITTFPDYETLSLQAAAHVWNRIIKTQEHKNSIVLGLPTGSTPIGMYKHLVRLLTTNNQQSALRTFNLDEYYPIKHDDPQSYHFFMKTHFGEPIKTIALNQGVNVQFNIPDGESANPENECQRYEELIKKHGPIDLMILGIGTNGHIGFNEPGSPPDSRTRVVNLSEETIKANSRFFSSENDVPKRALTMGLGTILESKEILVLVSGGSKKPILQQLVSLNEPTPGIPASWLMNHPHVTWFVDEEASPDAAYSRQTQDTYREGSY